MITVNYTNKRGFLWVFTAVLLLLVMMTAAVLPVCAAYPKNDDGVADDALVLSEYTVRTLRNSNATLKADLGVMIAVCTVKTTGDTEIGEYARGLFKSWNLGDGILLLIAVDDDDYYFVQSKAIEKLITNDELAEVRDNFLAADFDSGNIDRGVLKTVTRISSILVDELKKAAEAEEKNRDGEEEGTVVGSIIVGIAVFCLVVVLIFAALIIGLFIASIFNDKAADIFRVYVLRKPPITSASYNYDERLYGQPNRDGNRNGSRNGDPARRRQGDPYAQNRRILDQRSSNPSYNPHRTAYNGQLDDDYSRQYAPRGYAQQGYAQRGYDQQNAIGRNGHAGQLGSGQQGYPRQNPQRRPQQPRPDYAQQGGYAQTGYGQGNSRTYYNADGTVRRPQQVNRRLAPGQAQQRSAQYNENQMNGDETRAFTIPGRGNY